MEKRNDLTYVRLSCEGDSMFLDGRLGNYPSDNWTAVVLEDTHKTGTVEDVRTYPRALSAADVKAIASAVHKPVTTSRTKLPGACWKCGHREFSCDIEADIVDSRDAAGRLKKTLIRKHIKNVKCKNCKEEC